MKYRSIAISKDIEKEFSCCGCGKIVKSSQIRRIML